MDKALETEADSDPAHGKVVHVSGTVPPALPWLKAPSDTDPNSTIGGVSTAAPYTIDLYWQSLYTDPLAMVPAYPAAGLGFGFQYHNKPFDGTQGKKYVGVAFDMKINDNRMTTLYTTYPMVGTDLPDVKNNSDDFPKDCNYYTATNPASFGSQTCFTSYRKMYTSTSPLTPSQALAPAGTWKRYCTLYSEVGVPSWANQATQDAEPKFDPTKILKMQWDMFQPTWDSTETAYFDFSVDNVKLITAAEAEDPKNNCNTGLLDAGYGMGGEG